MTTEIPANLLTVVMPNYNYGRFIDEAIRSVAAQTYAPIELIVVDDASTDDSVAVATETLSKVTNLFDTKLIALPENVGKLGALNRALAHVRGEYFMIQDSDDLLTPEYASRTIAELVEARKTDPSIGFIYTDCMLVSQTGEILDRGKSTAFDPKMLHPANEFKVLVAHEHAGQKPALAQDLKPVADAQDQPAAFGMPTNGVHDIGAPGDGAAPQVIAVTEPAGHDDEIRAGRQIRLRVPDEGWLDAARHFKRAHDVAFAVQPGEK